ncbi:MAG: hypothetical protein HKM02_09995 [Pseudomonadales bacterium]|nr:hypothetical protein [Pseudomonadales bacterium]
MKKRALGLSWIVVAWLSSPAWSDDFPVPSNQNAAEAETQGLGPEWKLIRQDHYHNIKFYLRKDSNYRVSVNRMDTVFDAPLASIVAATIDVDGMNQWIWHLRSAELIKRESPHDLIIHLIINSPYGIEDRDAVIHTHVSQDPKTRVVRLTTESVDGYLPEQPPLVRMAKLQMNWVFTPRSDGKITAQMTGIIDPGGRIPAWTANIIQRSSLYYSLKSLMRISKDDRYTNPTLPFPIQE